MCSSAGTALTGRVLRQMHEAVQSACQPLAKSPNLCQRGLQVFSFSPRLRLQGRSRHRQTYLGGIHIRLCLQGAGQDHTSKKDVLTSSCTDSKISCFSTTLDVVLNKVTDAAPGNLVTCFAALLATEPCLEVRARAGGFAGDCSCSVSLKGTSHRLRPARSLAATLHLCRSQQTWVRAGYWSARPSTFKPGELYEGVTPMPWSNAFRQGAGPARPCAVPQLQTRSMRRCSRHSRPRPVSCAQALCGLCS